MHGRPFSSSAMYQSYPCLEVPLCVRNGRVAPAFARINAYTPLKGRVVVVKLWQEDPVDQDVQGSEEGRANLVARAVDGDVTDVEELLLEEV